MTVAPERIDLQVTVDARATLDAAVAFLLSEDARAITGVELFVDAGTTAMLFEQ